MPIWVTKDFAAGEAARQQHMAGLFAEEGDGFLRLDAAWTEARSRHRAPEGTSTARIGLPAALRRSTSVQRPAVERPRQAGAEQRVDHQIGPRRIDLLDGAGLARPVLKSLFGVAAQETRLAERADLHVKAGFAQQPGGDIAVAAIVAGAAEHGDPPTACCRAAGRRRRRRRFSPP